MALLEAKGLEVRFGGVAALRGVDLHVPEGAVTGLIGPNGAGKTTAFNAITGMVKPTSGQVLMDGCDITSLSPHRRARRGIARTFQRLEVFGSLSVYDNVLVAAEIRRRWSRDGSRPPIVAREVIELVGLSEVASERAENLPTGTARLVEVARALAQRPSMLLLDEPSAGLDEQETDELGRLLVRIAVEGMGILLVEHDVELVMSVCTRIHVLDFGQLIAVAAPAEIRTDPLVRAAYLGTADDDEVPEAALLTAMSGDDL